MIFSLGRGAAGAAGAADASRRAAYAASRRRHGGALRRAARPRRHRGRAATRRQARHAAPRRAAPPRRRHTQLRPLKSGPVVSGVLVGFPGGRQGNGHFPLADVNAAGSSQKAPVLPPIVEEVRGDPRLSRWRRECPPGQIGKGAGSSARQMFHTPLRGLRHCFTSPCS